MFREIGFETPARFIHALNTKLNEIMPYYVNLYKTTMLEYDPLEVVNYKQEYVLNKSSNSSLDNVETGKSNGTGSVNGESTVSSNSSNTDISKSVENDTPQTLLGNQIEESIDNFTNASKINHGKNNNTQETSSTSNDSTTTTANSELENTLKSLGTNKEDETMAKEIKGKYGSTPFQELIKKERELILNIDMMIINDLEELFLLIY